MAEKNRTETAAAEDALAVELLNSMGPAQDDPRSRTGRAGADGEDGEGREAGEGAYLSNIHIGSSETPGGFGRGHADDGPEADSAQPGVGSAAPRLAARADSAVAASVDLPDLGLHADGPVAGGPTHGAGGGLTGLASALFEQVADLFRAGEPAPAAPERSRVPNEELPVETPATVAVKVAVDDDPPVEGHVDDTATAPALTVEAAAGLEDGPISLNIAGMLGDADGSETLSIVVGGVPAGALLSAGIDNGDGSWTLVPADLAGLTITPPADSDADFSLQITATSRESNGGITASTTAELAVTVNAVADAATLAVNDSTGLEDSAILLDIASGLTDVDGSETLSIVIGGVPSGAILSAGTDNGDGSWTLTPSDLAGLTVTPGPDSDDDFTLTVTATTTDGENGDTETVSATVDVTVNAVADAPVLAVNGVTGNEDSAILLDISSALADVDGSEALSITIDGVPPGAVLSAGIDNGSGSWTLTRGDLADLTITPPADTDSDFTLTVTATTTEGENGDTETVTANLDVTVNAVADAASLVTNDASGSEDSAIALDIASAMADVDGSETSSITIDGMPTGAVLSAGTDNGDGSWTLSAAQLSGLTVTPPSDSDGGFTLTVTATTTEGENGDTETIATNFDVTVNAVADAATLAVNDAAGLEDGAILLDIASALTDIDGSETLSIVIDGMPAGAVLSAGTDNGDGSWTLDPPDLAGLTVTPPADSDADFTLTVTATTTEGGNSHTETVTANFDVTVSAVADAATLTVNDVAGNEDSAILLDISSALTDVGGSETLSIVIDGMPAGAVLSAGTDNGDGSWTLDPSDLAGLTVTPPADSDADFTLTVTATTTEGGNGDTETVTASFDVTIAAVADVAALAVSDVAGSEDSAIALNIAGSLADVDGSEMLSIVIDGVPTGAALSAGTNNGDGSWILSASQLPGLTITPPADSDGDVTLTVTATTTEGGNGDTETVTASFDVTVKAVADAPDLAVNDAAGFQDTGVALDISGVLGDLDGSESLTITVEGVPDGAALSAGADNGDGSWTLTPGDLPGLTVFPPAGSDADFTLTVSATAEEGENGNTATVSADIDVTVHLDPSFESRFAANSDGFTYADDAFGTSNPGYASGAWRNQGGGDGALRVTLGGINDNDINGMSGAWERGFDLEAAGHVVLSFQYKMTMTSEYESDEFSTVLAAVDGELLGSGGNDYIDRLAGNGNGGSSVSTGWQVFTIDLGELDAGSHTLELGGFNNLKTLADESTEILFDNVTVNINGEEVLIGGSGNDSLTGSDGKDTLYGLGGNDTLGGGGGADYIYGGDGRDALHGGDGNDVLSGGAEQDTLYGDAGNDILDGDGGSDTLHGGDGDDTLFGDTGNDRLYGDAGDDAIFGGSGNDDLYGGDGNDTLDGGSGSDELYGGGGDDAFVFGAGADSGWGGDGNDLLVFGNAGLLNDFDGGAGWTDTIRLEGVDGGPGLPLLADWTLLLTNGSIKSTNAESLDLSDDSAGTVVMSDGSELTFSGIEKIEW